MINIFNRLNIKFIGESITQTVAKEFLLIVIYISNICKTYKIYNIYIK